MEKLLLRHLKGSKAGETETFALSAYPDLLIGRDPASAVRFDPAQDDLVGRQHARIQRDGPRGDDLHAVGSRQPQRHVPQQAAGQRQGGDPAR
ncbi:MAG: FHA domain-containing protein [Gemmatimonadaceae bacterium]|nr:FHA domain-containing protein [Gemmatimonadaceae bacterium]